MSFNIAVTGVGGGVGQSVLKSLYNTDYNVIALDGEVLSAGVYASKSAYLIPFAKKPEFVPSLLELCKKENIHLLYPGLDAELKPLSLNRDKFKEIGCTVVVSDPSVIDISDDKQETYDRLSEAGLKVPFTTNLSGFTAHADLFPLIIKQKVGGARSKNVFLAKNESEFSQVLDQIGDAATNFIAQQYIEGDEYTCGTVNLEGECKGVVVMRRVLRDGDTYKCFTENNPLIEQTVRRAVEHIKPFGACNIQLRMKDGVPYIFEINARCSGTTAARTLSGFNEPKMIADFLLKGIEPLYEIREKTILRYWKELEVENEDVETFQSEGHLKLKDHSLL